MSSNPSDGKVDFQKLRALMLEHVKAKKTTPEAAAGQDQAKDEAIEELKVDLPIADEAATEKNLLTNIERFVQRIRMTAQQII
jgi:methyltransferase-like protein